MVVLGVGSEFRENELKIPVIILGVVDIININNVNINDNNIILIKLVILKLYY